MPTVTITRKEAEKGWLPEVCALTGEPTDGVKHRTFYWQPAWTFILLPVFLLPFLIVSLAVRKSMLVRLPLAHHKHAHWGWRTAVGSVLVVASSLAFIFGGATVSGYNTAAVGGWLMIAGAVGFVLSLVAFAALTLTGIHPKQITTRDITLGGVHQNFVDALEREREQEDEENAREEERRQEDRDRRRQAREEQAEREAGGEPPLARVPRAKRANSPAPDWGTPSDPPLDRS